jgi:hypothetical protein
VDWAEALAAEVPAEEAPVAGVPAAEVPADLAARARWIPEGTRAFAAAA